MKQHLALAASLVLLAACGGGGSGNVPATAQSKAPAKTAQGSVVISIPLGGTAGATARVRYPQFVSPNAQSVAMSTNGGADVLFDVSSTSPLCATANGARNCTLSFGAPAGSDAFAFLIFAGPNGTGTQLASASTSQTIAAGQAFNFTVALNAAVGTIVAHFAGNSNGQCPNSPQGQNVVSEGCPGSAALTVAVDDPSGAQITGSTPYAVPITVSANDPSLSVTPSQIAAPGQAATLAYTGAAWPSTFTTVQVAFSAGGSSAGLTIPVERSYLYVANSNAPIGSPPAGGGSVDVYAFAASGSAAPLRHLAGANTLIATPVKAISDSLGNLYVLDNGIPVGNNFNGNIMRFNTGTTGNVTPSATITNLGSLTQQPCSDMVFDPTQTYLFVACGTQINVFPVASLQPAGNLASNASTAQMEDDSAATQTGLAFDLSGNLFISDDSFNQILEVAAPVPTSGGYHASVGGGATVLAPPASWNAADVPESIAVDNAGNLYAPFFYLSPSAGAGDATAQLSIWNAGTALNCSSNCAPSMTFTGAPFTAHAVTGIALDPAGNVYVSNIMTGAITEFSRATALGGSATNPAQLRTLTNAGNGQASTPIGVWVGP